MIDSLQIQLDCDILDSFVLLLILFIYIQAQNYGWVFQTLAEKSFLLLNKRLRRCKKLNCIQIKYAW